MRRIEEVIDMVLEVIPEGHNLLKTDLEKVRQKVGYRAPESISCQWRQFVAVLNRYLPVPPVEEWHKEIADIMAARYRSE